MKRNLEKAEIFAVVSVAIVLLIIGLSISCSPSQSKTRSIQPAQIEVTNNGKEYEGVIVEGPTHLAGTEIAVVGVEVEVNGYKVIKPALISNFTYEEMRAMTGMKLKIKIKSVDIQKEGEPPLFVWVVQK